MAGNPTRFDEIAKQIINQYDSSDPRLSFIRHSDNITYKITTADGSSYLLRIHSPVTAALGAHGSNIEMVKSEMTWLLALRKDTHLCLQEPVPNKSGRLVTSIPDQDGKTINATLLTWIEGEPYYRDIEREDTACQIGEILATLHNHASSWVYPDDFIRPSRDIAYFKEVLEGLKPAVRDGRICTDDFSELSHAVSLLTDMIAGLDQDPTNYGIIHGDTHKGNMLYHEGRIRLIDFSFCALGNYLFDLGICFGDMKPELHEHCVRGYQNIRKLPEDHPRWIEGLFLGSVVGAFSFWVTNPNAQDLLLKKVPQITRDFAKRFNQNEHFWF